MSLTRYGGPRTSTKPPTLTKHQKKLYALVQKHGPCFIKSSDPVSCGQPFPAYKLDMTIWANLLATDALEYKGFIRQLDDGRYEAVNNPTS